MERVIELKHFGLDGLHRTERPTPRPGHGEVAIRIAGASLNYHDLATVLGLANPRMKLPCVPVSDGAGVVEEIGDGVTGVKVGDRVTSSFFPRWLSGAPTRAKLGDVPGEQRDGCLQDVVVLPAASVVPTPAHLTDIEASTLPCAALTAWRALVVNARIKPGDRVLLLGTGGVSLFAMQFALMHGCEVVITSSSDEKLKKVKGFGAHHCINYKHFPDWGRRARELVGGEGVDVVVEVGGSGTFNESLNAIRIGGHISVIGVLSGIADRISTAKIMAMNAVVQGTTVGSHEDFLSMNRAITAAKLRPVIGEVMQFEHAKEALALMQRGGHYGKICLEFGR